MFEDAMELNEVEREEFQEAFDYQYVENFLKKMFVEIMQIIVCIEYKKLERAWDFGVYVDTCFEQIYSMINNRLYTEEFVVKGIKNDETREAMYEKIMILKDVKKDLRKLKRDYKRLAKETEKQIMESCQDTEFSHKVERIVREEVTEWKKTHQLRQYIIDRGEDNYIKSTASYLTQLYLYPTEAFIKSYIRKELNRSTIN